MNSEKKTGLPEEKQPIEGCDHRWKQTGYWDGRNMKTHKKVAGSIAKCTICDGIRRFAWEEWYALPKEIRTELWMPKHDPQEDDPKLGPIIKEAAEEAQRIVYEKHGLTEHQMGIGHEIWTEQKRILKKKGIDWKSPGEMNPTTMFD